MRLILERKAVRRQPCVLLVNTEGDRPFNSSLSPKWQGPACHRIDLAQRIWPDREYRTALNRAQKLESKPFFRLDAVCCACAPAWLPIGEQVLLMQVRFSLRIIFVVTAIFCSSLVAFGRVGVFVPIPVLIVWAMIFFSPRPRLALAVIGAIVAAAFVFFHVLVARRNTAPSFSVERAACADNLRQIGIALQHYHNRFESLPPARTVDKYRNAHSWRVLILPFLGQRALYDRYRFDEPWNSPLNREIANEMPDVYRCPSRTDRMPHTSYVAITGEQTMWPDGRGRSKAELADAPDSTVLLTEFEPTGIHWMAPDDVGFLDAVRLLSSDFAHSPRGHKPDHFFFDHPPVDGHMLFSNGQVQIVGFGVSEEVATSLLTFNGGENISPRDLMSHPYRMSRRVQMNLKADRFIAVVALCALVSIPIILHCRTKPGRK